MSSTKKLRFEGHLTLDEAVRQLQDLADGLRSGTLTMESGDETVELALPNDVKLELDVEAQPSSRKARIDLSITWRSAEEAPVPRELIIRAKDAVVPPALSKNGASSSAAARSPRDARKSATISR